MERKDVMSRAKDLLRQGGRDLSVGVLGPAAGEVLAGIFDEGYNEAAHICVSVLSMKIDELHTQIKSGPPLSDREQFLLSSLTDLKSEIDDALRAFYNNAGGE